MTREQFANRHCEFERRDRRSNAIYLTTFFGFLALVILLSQYVPSELDAILALVLVVVLGLNAIFIIWASRNQAARHGLICVSCHGGLLGTAGVFAVATNRCCHCGESPFDAEQGDQSSGS